MSDQPTNLTPDSVLYRSDRAAWREFAGEVVLLDVPNQQMMGLSAVGGEVWQLIDGQHTLTQISQQIATKFEQPEAVVQADVLAFVETLVDKRCVSLTPPAPAQTTST